MLESSDAVEHELYYGSGMDALVIGCSCRYCGHQTQSNTSVTRVWAWMLWSPDAVESRYYGLGMDALVPGCNQTLKFLWFKHGYSAVALRRPRRQHDDDYDDRTVQCSAAGAVGWCVMAGVRCPLGGGRWLVAGWKQRKKSIGILSSNH